MQLIYPDAFKCSNCSCSNSSAHLLTEQSPTTEANTIHHHPLSETLIQFTVSNITSDSTVIQDISAPNIRNVTPITSVRMEKLQKEISRSMVAHCCCFGNNDLVLYGWWIINVRQMNFAGVSKQMIGWSPGQSSWLNEMCTWRGFSVSRDARHHICTLSGSNGLSRKALLRRGLWFFEGVIIGRRTRAAQALTVLWVSPWQHASLTSGMLTVAVKQLFKILCAKYYPWNIFFRNSIKYFKKLTI